jgi:DNA replication and repair protein RecF
MLIDSLSLYQVRNIRFLEIAPVPQFNLFCGANGAGKTSLLEAIYSLGLGRSFRASTVEKMIHHDADSLSILADLTDQHGFSMPVKLERARNKETHHYLGANLVKGVADIAALLPLQLMTQESYQLLDDGPKIRRNYLDQGLFYVDPHFYKVWKRFNLALKQKNAALKARLPLNQLESWNIELAADGAQLTELRANYLMALQPIIQEVYAALCPALSIDFEFQQGWPQDLTLEACLEQALRHDYLRGHSTCGPQRADVIIRTCQKTAADVLSRGQKKLLVYALKMAQSIYLHQIHAKSSIYLIDEMPAELDQHHRKCVVSFLADMGSQVFITGAVAEDFSDIWSTYPAKMFHVKHGEVSLQPELC